MTDLVVASFMTHYVLEGEQSLPGLHDADTEDEGEEKLVLLEQ